jgi:hypothetical protein
MTVGVDSRRSLPSNVPVGGGNYDFLRRRHFCSVKNSPTGIKYLITLDRKASTYQKLKGAQDMDFRDRGHKARVCKRTGNSRILAIFIAIAVVFIVLGNVAFAANNTPKYQVVNGSDDKAYLVNTSTGFVWVLTYRTTATGREPIAIPYKFIKICPKNQKDFIVEEAEGACMPGK